MRRGWGALVLAAGLATAPGCMRDVPGGAPAWAPGPATQGGGSARRFTFAWRAPCRVPVVERVDQHGRRATFSYDVVLSTTRDPELLEVRMERLRPIEVDGRDATAPAAQEQLRPMVALLSALPILHVSRDGAFVDTSGEEALAERMLELGGYKDGTPAGLRVREMLLSPQSLATMRERAGDYWRVWVGAWVGMRLAPGETSDGVEELPVPGGVLRAPVRYRNEGPVGGNPSVVRLVRVSTLAGPEVDAFMTGVLADLARATGKSVEKAALRSARRTTTITAETDPATLRPLRTSYQTETELEMADAAPQTQRQLREATFDWSAARGCGG